MTWVVSESGSLRHNACVTGHSQAEDLGKKKHKDRHCERSKTRGSTALCMKQKLRFAGNPQNGEG